MTTEDKKEEELKIVGPAGVIDEPDTVDDPKKPDEEQHDERSAQAEDSELTDEQREERRRERHERKNRQREARNRDKTELEFLRKRNEALERRFSAIENQVARQAVDTVETRIANIRSQLKVADGVIAKAIEEGEGADAVEAQSIKSKLESTLERLEGAKRAATQRPPVEDDEPEADKPDPKLIKAARSWMQKNDWYDPARNDEDSAIVGAIEDRLFAEGELDPSSSEYWEELDRRVAKRLPNLKKKAKLNGDSDDDEEEDDPLPRKNSGGPKFSTGGRTRTLKPGEVYVSPERKAAMIDAGVWDDPKLRQRYLKQYAAWDKEHSSRNAN